MQSIVRWLGLLLLIAVVGEAVGAPFPSRTVTLVVPYSPGASPDTLARLLAPILSASLGQSVVVENRPGASGNVAGAYVSRSASDGHTILLATQPMLAINPSLFTNLGYDPVKELTPITACANVVMALSVNPEVPATNMTELVAYLKAHPGTAYGTSGIGTPMHLAGLRLERIAHVDVTHVAYRGGAQVLNDLIGNQIKFAFVDLGSSMEFAKSGKIRLLAIGESTRFDGASDLPTMGESLPGFGLPSWFAFFGPARMPAETTDRWNLALRDALNDPALRAKLHAIGIVTRSDGPEVLARLVRQDSETFGREIKENHITMQ